SSKENLVIVKPPKLDSFVQLRGFTSQEALHIYTNTKSKRILHLIYEFSHPLESVLQLYPASFLCYAKIICGRYINARGWKDEQEDRFWSKKRFYLDQYQKR
ncbi:hypothetical protein, partial [Ligilactobacillus murinus]|uniref:hypothetical protein n=1 Tax=Ligilactobacillus murinus TaxID=1622 RepID=UPI001C8C9F39